MRGLNQFFEIQHTMLLSESEYSYLESARPPSPTPSAAPPVLGGQLLHYPGAPTRLRLPPHYLSYLEWSRCRASRPVRAVRLILNDLVSQRAYAPLRQ